MLYLLYLLLEELCLNIAIIMKRSLQSTNDLNWFGKWLPFSISKQKVLGSSVLVDISVQVNVIMHSYFRGDSLNGIWWKGNAEIVNGMSKLKGNVEMRGASIYDLFLNLIDSKRFVLQNQNLYVLWNHVCNIHYHN